MDCVHATVRAEKYVKGEAVRNAALRTERSVASSYPRSRVVRRPQRFRAIYGCVCPSPGSQLGRKLGSFASRAQWGAEERGLGQEDTPQHFVHTDEMDVRGDATDSHGIEAARLQQPAVPPRAHTPIQSGGAVRQMENLKAWWQVGSSQHCWHGCNHWSISGSLWCVPCTRWWSVTWLRIPPPARQTVSFCSPELLLLPLNSCPAPCSTASTPSLLASAPSSDFSGSPRATARSSGRGTPSWRQHRRRLQQCR